jgi:TolB protein
MNVNGSDVRRISFGDAKYSQPVWSPRGDLIAFTKREFGGNDVFYIGVMDPDGGNERTIATGWLVESPCWSTNGRYLIFSKEAKANNKSNIYMVDLTGRNIRLIPTPRNAFDGAWSPLLK